MKRIAYSLLLLIFSIPSFAAMLNSTNFEKEEAGTPYTKSVWESEGFTIGWHSGMDVRTAVDDTVSYSGRKSLRFLYPKGCYGNSNTGAQATLKFQPQDEAYMSYWIRFSEDFSFGTTQEGGKLPGLSSGADCSGMKKSDGTNGFTARFMWREGGILTLLLYEMDMVTVGGDDYVLKHPNGMNIYVEKGKWMHIAQRVKINTDGNTKDGEVEVWVNGNRALFLDGLRFTSNGDKVDKLYISTFHGGGSTDWAPTHDSYIWFDDIRIGTAYEDVAFQNCSKPNLGKDRTLCLEPEFDLTGDNSAEKKYAWSRNGQNAGNSSSLKITEPGRYLLTTDSAWCSQKDTVEVFEQPKINLGEDRRICATSFVNLASNIQHDKLSYSWKKDGQPLAGNTPEISVKEADTYSLTVQAENCETTSDEVTLTSRLLQINDTTGNVGEEFSLKVENPTSTYTWQDESQNLVATGDEFSSKFTDGETTYYVKDDEAFTGLVGLEKITFRSTYYRTHSDYRMKFETYKPLTIDSVTIYSKELQDVVVRILADDEKTVVKEVKFPNTPSGEHRLAIDAFLPETGTYFMDAVGSTGNFFHANQTDTAVHYPFTLDNVISILGSSPSKPTWYLYFYNWRVSVGNVCAATPVIAKGISSESALPSVEANGITLFPTETAGEVYLSSVPENAQIIIFDELGRRVKYTIAQEEGYYKIEVEGKGMHHLLLYTPTWKKEFKFLRK